MKLFDRLMGDIAVEQIDEDVVHAFQDKIKKLPPLRGSMINADLNYLINTTPINKRVSPATVNNKRLTEIRSLQRHAAKSMRLILPLQDARTMVHAIPVKNDSSRVPFLVEDVNRILCTRPKQKDRFHRESVLWISLIGAFPVRGSAK